MAGDDLAASVVLPKSLFTNIIDQSEVGLNFALYHRSTLLPLRQRENLSSIVADRTTVVGSSVIAATVGSGLPFNNLKSPIGINLTVSVRNDSVSLIL